MIFDLQLFASVTINDDAVNNGVATGQGEDVIYSITSVAAQAKIDVDVLSDEAKAAIANGTTGTVTIDGNEIEVNIASDGTITRTDGNVEDVIGQVVQFVAGGGSTITASVNNLTPTYAVNNGETVTGDTVLSGIYAQGDDGLLDTSNPYSVTIRGGLVTAISNNDGEVELGEELTLSTNPTDTQAGTDTYEAQTQITYDGSVSAKGANGTVTFTVNVDENGNASYSANGSALSGNTYTESEVTVGSYTVTADALTTGKLVGEGNAPTVDVTSSAGTATATFANGVVVDLAVSDTSKAISYSVNGVAQSDTSKIVVGDIVYDYVANGSSGTLKVDTENSTSYSAGIESGTALDNATYIVKAGNYTLEYQLVGHDTKDSATTTAQLISVTDNTSGTYTVNASDNTFTDADNNVYTATGIVESLAISGNLQIGGNVKSTETFVATSGENTATFGEEFNNQVITVTSPDGTTWTATETTILAANGIDTFNISVNESGTVIATADHGITSSDTATFTAATDSVPSGYSTEYKIGDASVIVTFADKNNYSVANAVGFDSSTSTSVTLGDFTYNFQMNANSEISAVPVTTEFTDTVKATAVQGAQNGTIKAGTAVTLDYNSDGNMDASIYVDTTNGGFTTETGVLNAYGNATIGASTLDGLTFNSDGTLTFENTTFSVASDTALTRTTDLTSAVAADSDNYKVSNVAAVDGTDTLKINVSDLGITDANSELTLQVTFDSASEITSAQLIGADGTSEVTVGQLGTFTYGDKEFALNLSSAAMADGDLTASDVSVVGNLDFTSNVEAVKNGDEIKFQYDKNTQYVLSVTDIVNNEIKVTKVTQLINGDVAFSTAYDSAVSKFALNATDNALLKPTPDAYEISFVGSAAAPRFKAEIGEIKDKSIQSSALSIFSTFSHAPMYFGTTSVGATVYAFGTTATWGTMASVLGTIPSMAYGDFSFKLGSELFGGSDGLQFTFNIDTSNFSTTNAFSSGIALGNLTLQGQSITFDTNFSSLYTTNADMKAFGGNENSSLFNSSVSGFGTFGTNGAQLVLFNEKDLWYDSNGLDKVNGSNDVTLHLTTGGLTVFGGTNGAYKTTFQFSSPDMMSAISTMFTGLTNTALGTAGIFGTGSGFYSAFSTNGFLGKLTTADQVDTNKIVEERNVYALFGTATKVDPTSALGTAYFGTGQQVYAIDVDEDGLFDFYQSQVGTNSTVYNQSGKVVTDISFDVASFGTHYQEYTYYQVSTLAGKLSTSSTLSTGKIDKVSIQISTSYTISVNTNAANSKSLFTTAMTEILGSDGQVLSTSATGFKSRTDYSASGVVSVADDEHYYFTYRLDSQGATPVFENVYFGTTVVAATETNIALSSGANYTFTGNSTLGTFTVLGTSGQDIDNTVYTVTMTTTGDRSVYTLSLQREGVEYNADNSSIFTLGSTVDAIVAKTTYTFAGIEFTTDTASAGTFTTTIGTDNITYTLNFSSGSIESLSSSTTTTPASVKMAEDKNSYDMSYFFSDTTNGYNFTVDTAMTITSLTINDSDVSLTKVDGGVTWSDTKTNSVYTAKFVNEGNPDEIDASDSIVITMTNGAVDTVKAIYNEAVDATPDHYEKEITLGDKVYTVKTADTQTGSALTFVENGTETTVSDYTVNFVDPDAAVQGDEYFTYYSNSAVTVEASMGEATIKGTVGIGTAKVDAIKTGTTYTLSVSTAADGTTYTYLSGADFEAVTGASGSTIEFTDATAEIQRQISGATIAGVNVTLYESGTSVNDLTLYNITGDGVTFDADSLTINGTVYTISKTSDSNYNAKIAESVNDLTSSDILITPTTYQFTANGVDYNVAVDSGTVKSYANNEYGEVVDSIVVKGDIVYTINYNSSDHTASVEGVINGATYSTASATLTDNSELYLTINNQRIFASSFTEGTYTTQYGGTRYVFSWNGEDATATYYTSTEAIIYNIASDGEETTTLFDSDGNLLSGDTIYTARWLGSDGETYVTATGTASQIAELAAADIAEDASIELISHGNTIDANVGGDKSYKYVSANNTSTTATIVNDVATLSGVTLSFVAGEDGTYTTVNGISIDGSNFTIPGSDNATLAVRGEDGTWTINDTTIDNIKNETDSPITLSANGDTGVLGAGAAYNPDTNELVEAGTGKSAIKNEDGYTTSDGKVTGLNSDGTVEYDENGNMVITGANEETKIGDESLPVTGDDNYNVTMSGGEVVALDGISDGATVSKSDIPVNIDSDATVTFTGDGTVTVNGSEIAQSGDEDGIKVTANEDGSAIAGISDVAAGASITAPSEIPVATEEESGTFVVNGTTLNTDDPDGITITPIGDGFQIEGLNEGSMLSADSEDGVPVTVGSGDNTLETSLSTKNSVKGAADGETPTNYNISDQSMDDLIGKLNISSDVKKQTVTTDDISEDGTIDFSESETPLAIRLSEGIESATIVLPTIGGSIVQIDEDATGEFTFEGSDAGDNFINLSPNAKMNAKGGAGADYYKTASKDDKIDLANGGKDTLDIMENGGTIENYDPTAEDAPGILVGGANTQESLLESIKNGALQFGDNTIGDGDNQITMNDLAEDDRTVAKFITEDGEEQLFAWTGEDGGTLNGTDLPEGSVLVGNAGGSHSGSNITAGANQTAIAGEGDVVAAGTGSTIEMTHNGDGAGAQIDAENSTGTVEVNGFTGGFSGKHNGFRKNRSTRPGLSLLNGLLTFLIGGLTAVLNANNSAEFIEKNDESSDTLLIATNTADYTDPATGVLETSFTDEDGNAENYVMIGDEKEYKVSDESLDLNFVGTGSSKGSGVSFDNLTDVDVDLSSSDTYTFSGISTVQAAAGASSLISGDDNTMGLVAGEGETTIIGGAGVDTIYGYEGSSETTIMFTEGSGNDVVKNFQYGSEETSDKFDFAQTALSRAEFDGDDLKITVDGGDVLTIENAKNNKIKANAEAMGYDGVVEFGNDVTYDEEVNMYGNYNTENNKMTLTDSNISGDTVKVYLNGQNEYGQTFDGNYYYNVNEIDASALTKEASIAGYDNLNDTIRGGKGANYLWGGLGGDDLLVAGTGTNTFFYLNGDGNDTVQSAKSGDTIELWNTSLDDLDLNSIAENSTTKSIAVKFNNGDTLTVTGTNLTDVGFKVGQDGDTWKINSNKTWSKKDDEE